MFDEALDPAKLIGQNLGYAFTNLPQLADLLVDEATARRGDFDLIVDTNGGAGQFDFAADRVLDINAL